MSNLTALEYIQERSQATPGLWNQRFSTISANLAALNSDLTLNLPSGETFSLFTNLDVSGNIHAARQLGIGATPSAITTGTVTIAASSAVSDYIHFEDSSNAKSDYLLGSRVGGTSDGLNLWDLSGSTMIVSFSKQSVRFYQNVVGPVFDVGGALADTYNAATFGTGAQSDESRIQSAIDQASIDVVSRVYVPANMYPYSASSVSFVYTVQMVREGGEWSVYDVRAYGASGNAVANDRAAIQGAVESAAEAGGGVVLLSDGTFAIASGITLRNNIQFLGRRGAALFALSTYSELANQAMLHASGVSGIRIRDLTIHGNRSNNSNGGTISIISGYVADSVRFDGCLDCVIEDCLILESMSHGVHFEGNTERCAARNNYVENAANSAFMLHWRSSAGSRPTDCIVEGNVVVSPCIWPSLGGEENAGIWLATTKRCKVVNNSIISSNWIGIHLGSGSLGPDASENFIAHNNVFSSKSHGLHADIAVGTVHNNTFLGNSYISNLGDDIVLLKNGVVGNVFVGDSYISSAQHGVDMLAGADRNIFVACHAASNTSVGFLCAGGDQVEFYGCIAEKNAAEGLHIGSNTSYVRWIGGQLSNATSGTNPAQRRSFVVTGSAINAQIANAFIAFNTNAPIDSGQSTMLAFNDDGAMAALQPMVGSGIFPTYAFASEVSLGFYRSGASTIAQSYGTFTGPVISTNTIVPASGNTLVIRAQIGFNTVPGGPPEQRYVFNLPAYSANAPQWVVWDNNSNAGGLLGNFVNPGSRFKFSSMNLGNAMAERLELNELGQISSITVGQAIAPAWAYSSESSLGWYRSGVSTMALSYGTLLVNGPMWSSGISVGPGGSLIPQISSMSSLVGAFIVQGSSSSFTGIAWTGVAIGDIILCGVIKSGAASSISSGLVAHSHVTVANQIEFRLSNVSTLVQNQSAQSWVFTRIRPF